MLRVHYTSDPAKADPRWIEHAKTDVPTDQWAREMEMNAEAGLGLSIYGREYKPEIHERPLAPNPNLPMGHGWDFGHGWPAHVWVQRTAYNGVRILASKFSQDSKLRLFIPQVIAFEINVLGQLWESRRDYCDPAGNQPKDDGLKSVDVLREFGLRPHWRGSEYTERHEHIARLLLTNQEDGEPMLLIDPRYNVELCQGFRATYKRDKAGDPERIHPVIDLMNALEYYLMNTKAPSRRVGAPQALPMLNPVSGYGVFTPPREHVAAMADPW